MTERMLSRLAVFSYLIEKLDSTVCNKEISVWESLVWTCSIPAHVPVEDARLIYSSISIIQSKHTLRLGPTGEYVIDRSKHTPGTSMDMETYLVY